MYRLYKLVENSKKQRYAIYKRHHALYHLYGVVSETFVRSKFGHHTVGFNDSVN